MLAEASTIQRTTPTPRSEACGSALSVNRPGVGWVLAPRDSSEQKSCTITGAGPHYLLWHYIKDASGSNNGDCGWVDYLQWTGSSGSSGSSANWSQIEYTYDPSGRRIAKDVDGVVTKYLVACPEPAEWDANDVLLRKFIYGPSVDHPICMIDVADSNLALSPSNGAPYYYHYDALGSVVALSDSAGDTVQLYEYDVYGQVAASDPNHPNPFLFTGRRYDAETGLYYYRARYYNPSIGRFLQTDPIGYGDGMNTYHYCSNSPVNRVDPSGCRDFVHDENFYTFEFTFPVDCIADFLPPDSSDLDIGHLVRAFLDSCGFNDAHPGWTVAAHLESDGTNIHALFSWQEWTTNSGKGEPKIPSHRVGYATVWNDTGRSATTIVGKYPIMFFDEVGLLNTRTLFRIIKPAIQEVNAWNRDSLRWQYYAAYKWDSWFGEGGHNGKQFRSSWNPSVVYLGSEINYIVGGHVFAHFGMSYEQGRRHVYAWKLLCRLARRRRFPSIDDPSLAGTWDWFRSGYLFSDNFEEW